jgi:guanosine-3',5'-bis(diphosphate) 3'-pyrophosphohydrolase
MIYSLDDLKSALKSSDKKYSQTKILKAYNLANEAHQGQIRVSGDPYISHPIAVALILIQLGMDSESLCAALLHDVVEDTKIPLEFIEKEFSKEIGQLVDGVTKLGQIPLVTKEEQQAENVRKMLLAMSKDIRVIIIKLADRLHNMRTLNFLDEQKQRDKSLETMEIYAPIAHRLGIRAIKEELEDLALQYLDPIAYHEIEEILDVKKEARDIFIKRILEKVKNRLKEYKIHAHIEGRVKSIYGIYRKVYMGGRSFDEVFDIYAVRIIVKTDIECYNILGVIHDMFTPIAKRFKDYISTPKPNMYQSLHTTVVDKGAIPFEVQIRTWDMHYTAEYGIAAHWKYKAGVDGKDGLEERLAWVRKLIESGQESDDVRDLITSIKTDLNTENIFVFTPKGDVKSMPVGSTPIDFAYAIHSAVGNKMTGAKVDGRMIALDYTLKTGQIVEILTSNSPNHSPNRDWLKIAKTSEARGKIRAWFKKERREENVSEGKIELERELKRNLIHLSNEKLEELLLGIAKRQHCETLNDFYASIGYGGVLLSRIVPHIKDEYVKLTKPVEAETELSITPVKKSTNGIIVEGIDNCLVKFSQCCNPLPGDDIIGFVTRGHGVSVHKIDCVNILSSMNQKEQRGRFINVSWADDHKTHFRSTLDIVSRDRNGLLADLSMALANFRIPIHELNARELKNGNVNLVVTLGIGGVEQLKNIIQKLSKIEGIISIERFNK